MKELITKIKKNKQTIARFSIFIIISYFLVSLIFGFLSKNRSTNFEYNFFSFPVYTLILVVLFAIFNRTIFLNHKYEKNVKKIFLFSTAAIFAFIGYFFIKYSLYFSQQNFAWLFLTYTTLYLLGIVFVALAIFGTGIFKKTYISLLIFALITFFFYIITQILWELWEFLAFNVARIIYHILSLFSSTAVLKLGSGDPTLGIKGFSVIVGPPCSGIESLSMFIGLFLLLLVYEQKNLNLKRAGAVFVVGLIGTYFLNIFRVGLLLLIGTKYPDFAMGMFHSQAGWIIFSVFILILLYFGYRWMRKDIEHKQ